MSAEAPFNQSAFSLNDLYNKKWVYYYGIFWDTTFIITLIFVPFMFYAIMWKSTKEMGAYKYYLCHQLLWSFLFDIHMSLWKPVPLWPFFMGYSSGIYSNLNGKWIYAPFLVLGILVMGMGISIGISLLHRFVLASPFSLVYKIYGISWLRFGFFIGLFIFLQSGFAFMVFMLIPNDHDNRQSILIKQNAAFEIMFENEPSLFGWVNNDLSMKFLFALLFVLGFLVILITIVYFNFIRVLKKNKVLLSEATFKLQMILFKALSIQIFLGIVLLVIPITITLGFSIGGFTWLPKFVLCALSFTATHTIFEFTAIIYFVKAYRIFFIGLWKTALIKIGIKFKATVAPTMLPPPSTSATVPFFIPSP